MQLEVNNLGFFANSIQMSGSAFAEWSHSELVDDASLELARSAGCLSEDINTLKPCLKNKTIQELLDASNKTVTVQISI